MGLSGTYLCTDGEERQSTARALSYWDTHVTYMVAAETAYIHTECMHGSSRHGYPGPQAWVLTTDTQEPLLGSGRVGPEVLACVV